MSLHLARHGRASHWYYEHQTSHPIFHYPDILAALESGTVKEGLFESAAEQWRTLAATIHTSGQSVFIESAFFQIPVHPMRLMDWTDERIGGYVASVETAIAGASPLLVLLRHEDVPGAIDQAASWRGDWFLPFLEQSVARSAYGQARGLSGLSGVHQYFTAYRDLIDRRVAALSIETLVLDAALSARGDVLGAVASALGAPSPVTFETGLSIDRFAGKYIADQGEGDFDVRANGPDLVLNGDAPARLIHREANTFEIAGLPVTLRFVAGADGRMATIDCQGPLPDLSRTWTRAE